MIIKLIVKNFIYAFVSIMLISVSYIGVASTEKNSLPQKHHAQRIITTDWSIAETLLMLEAKVVGIGDIIQYNNWVISPRIPNSVVDLGLRAQPNMQALIDADANTLINSSWFQKILPPELIDNRYTLYAINFYTNDGLSWQNTLKQTQKLGEITGREAQANELIAQAESSIQANGLRLKPFEHRPIALVQFIDSRHLRIYGDNSLYGVVLNKLNLLNAWQLPTNGWGFQQITLLDLANLPSSTLLIIIAPLLILNVVSDAKGLRVICCNNSELMLNAPPTKIAITIRGNKESKIIVSNKLVDICFWYKSN